MCSCRLRWNASCRCWILTQARCCRCLVCTLAQSIRRLNVAVLKEHERSLGVGTHRNQHTPGASIETAVLRRFYFLVWSEMYGRGDSAYACVSRGVKVRTPVAQRGWAPQKQRALRAFFQPHRALALRVTAAGRNGRSATLRTSRRWPLAWATRSVGSIRVRARRFKGGELRPWRGMECTITTGRTKM